MTNQILTECLRTAYRLSPRHPERISKYKGYILFSFVIQGNKIIEHGMNRGGNVTPLIGYKDHQKLHSENTAYFKARGLLNRRKPFDIVNIRLSRAGIIRLGAPCGCCCSFLKQLGCSRVWFTTEAGWAKIAL